MKHTYAYNPIKYYFLTFLLSWIPWFGAIWASWQPSMEGVMLPLVLLGLSGPALVALFMIIGSRNKSLWADFVTRLNIRNIQPQFLLLSFLLFPFLMVVSILISLAFGQPISQLSILTQSDDLLLQGKNFLIMVSIIFLIGPFEEIGWRGYGIDSLWSRFSLIKSTLIFGALWGLWHLPLFFIHNGGLQQEIWNKGLFHTFTYFSGLFFIAIITNWFYAKNKRNILVAIIFHSVYDLCLNVFKITSVTWNIIWILLLALSLLIVLVNKELFFKRLEILDLIH